MTRIVMHSRRGTIRRERNRGRRNRGKRGEVKAEITGIGRRRHLAVICHRPRTGGESEMEGRRTAELTRTISSSIAGQPYVGNTMNRSHPARDVSGRGAYARRVARTAGSLKLFEGPAQATEVEAVQRGRVELDHRLGPSTQLRAVSRVDGLSS